MTTPSLRRKLASTAGEERARQSTDAMRADGGPGVHGCRLAAVAGLAVLPDFPPGRDPSPGVRVLVDLLKSEALSEETP